MENEQVRDEQVKESNDFLKDSSLPSQERDNKIKVNKNGRYLGTLLG